MNLSQKKRDKKFSGHFSEDSIINYAFVACLLPAFVFISMTGLDVSFPCLLHQTLRTAMDASKFSSVKNDSERG